MGWARLGRSFCCPAWVSTAAKVAGKEGSPVAATSTFASGTFSPKLKRPLKKVSDRTLSLTGLMSPPNLKVCFPMR